MQFVVTKDSKSFNGKFLQKKMENSDITDIGNYPYENVLLVCLADGNEFPSWFFKDTNIKKDGILKIPLNYRERQSIFNYGGKKAGQDQNYRFYVEKIGVTEKITDEDIFVITIVIRAVARSSSSIPLSERLTKFALTYEILCPIVL